MSQAPLWPTGLGMAGLFLLAVTVSLAAFRPSPPAAAILATALVLSGIGLLFRFRLGSATAEWPSTRTDWAYVVGASSMGLMWLGLRRGRHQALASLAVPAGWGVIVLLAALLVFGHRFRGGVFIANRMNPSEIVKVLIPMCAAGWLSSIPKRMNEKGVPVWWRLAPSAMLWVGVPLLLLAAHRDFGMALQLCLVWVCVYAMFSGRAWHAVVGLFLTVAAAVIAFHIVPHARVRWAVWRNPYRQEVGGGWQLLQGLAALYHGKFWGRGLGAGSPHLIPIAGSDFIYAVMGEEIGYIGCGLLLAVYTAFFAASLAGAGAQTTLFSRLLGGGLVAMLAMQVLLHVAGVTAALPLTGIPLPFVSHGGSSMVVSLTSAGILAAIADGSPQRNISHRGRRGRSKPRRK